ncbi:MAG: SurA N-terminal domain-containing protein [Thermodesulfobacteriota bacterium]
MVLSLMRKHAKSWLIKFLIAIIAVVFIFYFGYSFTSDKALKVAYVNGELITGPEYQKAYREMLTAVRERYKGMWNDQMAKMFNLEKRALDGLINQRLMTQAARRLGLDVTEEETQEAIMSYPAFQVNGRFDMRQYQSLLRHNHMKPEDFEQTMSQELLKKKLEQFLFAFVDVTDREVLENYIFKNEKVNIGYVRFGPDQFAASVQVDEADMEAYYQEHKEAYRVPKKIKVAYIEIGPESFAEDVEITEKEVVSFYEYNMDQYKHPKEVKARHILFKADSEAADDRVKQAEKAAQKVLKAARQGEDFAELAKQHSEGPTRSEGGDLGYFKKGQMTPAFEEAAFGLKAGEISDPVRTRFGYHIIKVEDIREPRTETLEEVREEIEKTLIRNVATEMAHEKGLLLMDQMPYDIELPVYAEQHGLEAKYSPYFSQDEPIPGIEGSEKLSQSLFALEKKETSELVEMEGKFYIFQVAESKPSYIPPLKAVKAAVKADAEARAAEKAATSAASKLLEELKTGNSWDLLAKAENLTPEETGFFDREESIPKIGNAPNLKETAFALGPDKRYPDQVFETDQGSLVIRWLGREGIDKEKFQEKKAEYRGSLTETKHRRIFENWLNSLRKNAEIEIVNDVTA